MEYGWGKILTSNSMGRIIYYSLSQRMMEAIKFNNVPWSTL